MVPARMENLNLNLNPQNTPLPAIPKGCGNRSKPQKDDNFTVFAENGMPNNKVIVDWFFLAFLKFIFLDILFFEGAKLFQS